MSILTKLNPLAIIIIGAILIILVVALAANFIIRKKYREIGQGLREVEKNKNNLGKYNILKQIVEDYRTAAEGNPDEVNTQAIIEKNFNSQLGNLILGERFIKHSVSLMIILGLLGTFYGLTLSISKLVELLSNSANAEVLSSMDSIVGGLINSVKGMSVAFVTSLFGIASSILITVLNIIYNVEETRVSVMVQIEEYLDNKVALEFKHNIINEYNLIADSLKGTFEEFGGRIHTSFNDTMRVSSESLASVTEGMERAALSLLSTVEKFDKSLEKFSENTRDFSEFNYQLRTNIERMNVTFADFTDDLRHNIGGLARGQETLKEMATSIDKLSEKVGN